MQDCPVLTGRQIIFPFECPVKSGIITESDLFADIAERGTVLYQCFCSDQAALSDKLIKADINPDTEEFTEGTLADQEMLCRVL